MGKSRLLDEFLKDFFLILINLRSAGSQGLFSTYHLNNHISYTFLTGYPPPNHVVRTCLTDLTVRAEVANHLMRCFLLALF
jgi:hypothetical protein